MNDSPNLRNAGDFFLIPNEDLTKDLLTRNLSRNDIKDLIEIACHWFTPKDKAMRPEMTIGNNDGGITHMRIRTSPINSKW